MRGMGRKWIDVFVKGMNEVEIDYSIIISRTAMKDGRNMYNGVSNTSQPAEVPPHYRSLMKPVPWPAGCSQYTITE
jgi:hypothetical protein